MSWMGNESFRWRKKHLWIVSANGHEKDRTERRWNDFQWIHVKIENPSWQPTQQWFYLRILHFDWKIEIGERIAEWADAGSCSAWRQPDRHSIFNRFGKLISYCHSLSVLDFILRCTWRVSLSPCVCVCVLAHVCLIVSICCVRFRCDTDKYRAQIIFNKTLQMPCHRFNQIKMKW